MEKLTDHYWAPPRTDYMRWMEDERVVRVARTRGDGLVLALYPSKDPNVFYGEAFREIDDNSSRPEIRRENIKDDCLIKLLDGASKEEILESIEEIQDMCS